MGSGAKRDDTNGTNLHEAAAGGWPRLVELLFDRRANINQLTSEGQNVLQLAGAGIRAGDDEDAGTSNERRAEIIQLLVKHGLQMDFHTAIAAGDKDQVIALIRAKPDRLKEKDPQGNLPLQRAVALEQHSMVEALLQAGADVNGVGREGSPPLIGASVSGQAEMVRLLLDHGANPEIKGVRQESALSEAERVMPYAAQKQGYEEVIQMLRERIR